MSHCLVRLIDPDFRDGLVARLERIAAESKDLFTKQQIKDLCGELKTELTLEDVEGEPV